jgi:hypothetical protein
MNRNLFIGATLVTATVIGGYVYYRHIRDGVWTQEELESVREKAKARLGAFAEDPTTGEDVLYQPYAAALDRAYEELAQDSYPWDPDVMEEEQKPHG